MNDEKEAELEKLGVRSKHNSNFFYCRCKFNYKVTEFVWA